MGIAVGRLWFQSLFQHMSFALVFFAGAAHSLRGMKRHADKMSEKVGQLWAGSVSKTTQPSVCIPGQLSEGFLFWFCRGCVGCLWHWMSN